VVRRLGTIAGAVDSLGAEAESPISREAGNGCSQNPRLINQALIEPSTIWAGKTAKAVVVLSLGQGLVVSRNESSRDMAPLKMDFEESDAFDC
jgi:hypothetical protein